jgi:hypothetical protein
MPSDEDLGLYFHKAFVEVIKKSKFRERFPETCFCDLVSYEASEWVPICVWHRPHSEAKLTHVLRYFYNEATVMRCLSDIKPSQGRKRLAFITNRSYQEWVSGYAEEVVKPDSIARLSKHSISNNRKSFIPGQAQLSHLEIRFMEPVHSSTAPPASGVRHSPTQEQQAPVQGSIEHTAVPAQLPSDGQHHVSEAHHHTHGQPPPSEIRQHELEQSEQQSGEQQEDETGYRELRQAPPPGLRLQALPTNYVHQPPATASHLSSQHQQTSIEHNVRTCRTRDEMDDQQMQEERHRAKEEEARRLEAIANNRFTSLGARKKVDWQAMKSGVKGGINKLGRKIAKATEPQHNKVQVDGTHPSMSGPPRPNDGNRGRPLPQSDDGTVINMSKHGPAEATAEAADGKHNRAEQASTTRDNADSHANYGTPRPTPSLARRLRQYFANNDRQDPESGLHSNINAQPNDNAHDLGNRPGTIDPRARPANITAPSSDADLSFDNDGPRIRRNQSHYNMARGGRSSRRHASDFPKENDP